MLLGYVMTAEEKTAKERDEERFKFDLFTRRPDIYHNVYGDGADDIAEEQAEEFNPESEEDVRDLLAMVRQLEELAS